MVGSLVKFQKGNEIFMQSSIWIDRIRDEEMSENEEEQKLNRAADMDADTRSATAELADL